MTAWHADRLNDQQRAWIIEQLGEVELIRDMSWNLFESIVLHVRQASGAEFVVKAGGPTNHHIAREIAAHPTYTAPLVATGHAASVVGVDTEARVLILNFLSGELVEGLSAEFEPDTYLQAGRLLRRLHEQESRIDPEFEATANKRALGWLDGEHRIAADTANRARQILEKASSPPRLVVPTHGDWQPRNWLIDEKSDVKVIDFGRFAFRPASTDFARLTSKQWREFPELEAAFLDGYGDDPRDLEHTRLEALREAVGTAAWAFQVGEPSFEAQGHRMIDEALRLF